ncbi:hypothetical protein CK203_092845 [Vitis vinifera]|uniref:Uncharacterized protein n=1 Tax=Vitis vinifera TaxID=29760 RepID=A0A438DFG3_VITVI|nr:hypothetical protein CK203_092845 [Vitis vinifera]
MLCCYSYSFNGIKTLSFSQCPELEVQYFNLKLLLFGGHGTGGWLSRYDIYYNECIVLDRVSVQWKRLPTSNEPPPARAYHSMTCIGSRYLLFGGFDGKSTFDDLWWLVPEEDPIAKRLTSSPAKNIPEDKDLAIAKETQLSHEFCNLAKLPWINALSPVKEASQKEESAVSELRKRLDKSVSISVPELQIIDELEDKEFLELALSLIGVGEKVSSNGQISHTQAAQALRDHWGESTPKLIPLKELGPLLRDYQRLITRHHTSLSGWESLKFHLYANVLAVNYVIDYGKGKGGEGVEASHLLFADDTLVFCKDSQDQMFHLSWLLMWFEASLRLKIDLDKSRRALVFLKFAFGSSVQSRFSLGWGGEEVIEGKYGKEEGGWCSCDMRDGL